MRYINQYQLYHKIGKLLLHFIVKAMGRFNLKRNYLGIIIPILICLSLFITSCFKDNSLCSPAPKDYRINIPTAERAKVPYYFNNKVRFIVNQQDTILYTISKDSAFDHRKGHALGDCPEYDTVWSSHQVQFSTNSKYASIPIKINQQSNGAVEIFIGDIYYFFFTEQLVQSQDVIQINNHIYNHIIKVKDLTYQTSGTVWYDPEIGLISFNIGSDFFQVLP